MNKLRTATAATLAAAGMIGFGVLLAGAANATPITKPTDPWVGGHDARRAPGPVGRFDVPVNASTIVIGAPGTSRFVHPGPPARLANPNLARRA